MQMILRRKPARSTILTRHHLAIRANAMSIHKFLPLDVASTVIHWGVDGCRGDIVQGRTVRPVYVSYIDAFMGSYETYCIGFPSAGRFTI